VLRRARRRAGRRSRPQPIAPDVTELWPGRLAAAAVTILSNTRSLTSGRRAAIEGSAGDPDQTKRVAAEVDVVLSAFSPNRTGGNLREYLDLLTVVAETVGDARLVVVGGAGSLLINGQRVVDDPEYPEVWRPEALLMSEALAYIQGLGDDIDWTFCSPAVVIEPDGRTGQYLRPSNVEPPRPLVLAWAANSEPACRRRSDTVRGLRIRRDCALSATGRGDGQPSADWLGRSLQHGGFTPHNHHAVVTSAPSVLTYLRTHLRSGHLNLRSSESRQAAIASQL
jgi:hypothetical protein